MKSTASTVADYLAGLPSDRREAIEAVRAVILDNLPKGYEEGMQYGMIGYYVPHSVYPAGYHCDPKQPLPFASLASQKNHMALYLMCIYGDPEHEAWFRAAWAKTGKRLDMGKSCVRFKNIEDVPLKVIGQAVRRMPVTKYVAHYESVVGSGGRSTARRAGNKTTAKRSRTPSPRTGKATTRKGTGKPGRTKATKGAKKAASARGAKRKA